MDRGNLSSSHGVKSRIPQAPWVLHFDGASRKPAGHGGLGVVLRNSKGQVVEEEKRFLGAGVSSGLAKYKALVAGLKKAQVFQVKHLLAKGNSRILINQVVGRWTARDALLRDHLKKVWAIAKDFDSLFMEFIPKEHNLHADRIANAAIDKELQIQEVVSNYFDRSSPAWQFQASPQNNNKEKPPPVNNISPPAARILTPFSNPKLRPVSPRLRESHHDDTVTTSNGNPKSSLRSSLRNSTNNVTISQPRISIPAPSCGDDAPTSDSELTRTIKSLTVTKYDKFWADKLSISDEASSTSSTGSEDVRSSDFKSPWFKSSARVAGENGTLVAGSGRGSWEHDSGREDADDCEEQEDRIKKPVACSRDRSGTVVKCDVVEDRDPPPPAATAIQLGPIQLSEADCERLVETVIERLKKTGSNAGQP